MVPTMILIGKRFGKLTAISQRMIDGRSYHLCRCDCGKEREVITYNLSKGHTKSCGDPKTCSMYGPKPTADSDLRTTWNHYQKGSRSRGLSFDISFEKFKEIIVKECWYCGSPPRCRHRKSNATGREKLYIPHHGLDRVDNSKGYSEANVVPCCSKCNRAKDRMTQAEFLNLARSIVVLHP